MRQIGCQDPCILLKGCSSCLCHCFARANYWSGVNDISVWMEGQVIPRIEIHTMSTRLISVYEQVNVAYDHIHIRSNDVMYHLTVPDDYDDDDFTSSHLISLPLVTCLVIRILWCIGVVSPFKTLKRKAAAEGSSLGTGNNGRQKSAIASMPRKEASVSW